MRQKKHRFSEIHIHRLILFAEHLNKCKLQDYPMEYYCENNKPPLIVTGAGIAFICYPYIYVEIYKVFPAEWDYLTEVGLVIYLPNIELTTEEGLLEFFGTTSKQFLHCFVPRLQSQGMGGKKLHKASPPKDVAYNIYCLLQSLFPFSKRMVLVEKYP